MSFPAPLTWPTEFEALIVFLFQLSFGVIQCQFFVKWTTIKLFTFFPVCAQFPAVLCFSLQLLGSSPISFSILQLIYWCLEQWEKKRSIIIAREFLRGHHLQYVITILSLHSTKISGAARWSTAFASYFTYMTNLNFCESFLPCTPSLRRCISLYSCEFFIAPRCDIHVLGYNCINVRILIDIKLIRAEFIIIFALQAEKSAFILGHGT